MAHVIGQFVLAILESLAELFCFFTGKWLLLLITGGRVVPMPPTTPRSWSLWILVGIGLHLLFR